MNVSFATPTSINIKTRERAAITIDGTCEAFANCIMTTAIIIKIIRRIIKSNDCVNAWNKVTDCEIPIAEAVISGINMEAIATIAAIKAMGFV